jgi:hypothetical protein
MTKAAATIETTMRVESLPSSVTVESLAANTPPVSVHPMDWRYAYSATGSRGPTSETDDAR